MTIYDEFQSSTKMILHGKLPIKMT